MYCYTITLQKKKSKLNTNIKFYLINYQKIIIYCGGGPGGKGGKGGRGPLRQQGG